MDLSQLSDEQLEALKALKLRRQMEEYLKEKTPEATAGKMPMGPGQLPPIQDPERGYGGIAVPPNPFTTAPKVAGAGLGALTGGAAAPLGMALGSTANTPADLASMLAGSGMAKAARAVPTAANALVRGLQGATQGLGEYGASVGARNLAGEDTQPEVGSGALSTLLGILSRRNTNLSNVATQKLPMASRGKDLEQEMKSLSSDLMQAKDYGNVLTARQAEARAALERGKLALEEKGLKKSDILEATKKKQYLPTQEYANRKTKKELIDFKEEMTKNAAVQAHIQNLQEKTNSEYTDIMDKLGINKNSKTRQQSADLLNLISERIPIPGMRGAIYLHSLGRLMTKNNESKTAAAYVEKLAKQKVTADQWKEIDKIVPILVNEIQ